MALDGRSAQFPGATQPYANHFFDRPSNCWDGITLRGYFLVLSRLSWNWQPDVEIDLTQLLLPVLWDR